MSENLSGRPSGWAFSGTAQSLPGMSPRPQQHILDKKDTKEMVNSSSKSLFVYVKNCENLQLEVNGKVGKITLENNKLINIVVNDHVVSGTLEIIRCENVMLIYGENAVIPIVQVDNSNLIRIAIQEKSQIQNVYYIRTNDIKVALKQTENESLEYDLTPDSESQYVNQRIARWNEISPDAHFITEAVVRDGVYPTTAQMKKAADERKEKALSKMAEILADNIKVHAKTGGSENNLDGVD